MCFLNCHCQEQQIERSYWLAATVSGKCTCQVNIFKLDKSGEVNINNSLKIKFTNFSFSFHKGSAAFLFFHNWRLLFPFSVRPHYANTNNLQLHNMRILLQDKQSRSTTQNVVLFDFQSKCLCSWFHAAC